MYDLPVMVNKLILIYLCLGLKGIAKARDLAKAIIEHVYQQENPGKKPSGKFGSY